MSFKKVVFIYFVFILVTSCQLTPSKNKRAIIIQPFDKTSTTLTKQIYNHLIKINPNIILKKPIPLPPAAYYSSRNRYRADSLINYLSRLADKKTIIIGLTDKDISTTKGKIADWGIMGFGFQPGNACVISSFRLSKVNLADQYYKLALHELGHNEGLPHCPDQHCLMRDAEGKNHFNEMTGFCAKCSAFLKAKGWRLN